MRPNYVTLLKNELEKRIQQNPRYSLRSFAQSLRITPSGLSMVLSGQRKLSIKKRKDIVKSMPWTFDQIISFMEEHDSAPLKINKSKSSKENQKVFMELDTFELMSNWVHFAMLTLLDIESISQSPKNLAKLLGISEMEAKASLERLSRLGIISMVDGRYKQIIEPIRFNNQKSTSATIKFNLELLKKASEAIQHYTFQERSAAGSFFSVNSNQLPNLRKEINQFRNYLCDKYSQTANANSVYCLAVQCFPLTKLNKT